MLYNGNEQAVHRCDIEHVECNSSSSGYQLDILIELCTLQHWQWHDSIATQTTQDDTYMP